MRLRSISSLEIVCRWVSLRRPFVFFFICKENELLKMRIMIKGGVWKNTEDEILKAAVMKYGKNQWARVASLLSRKSAKQCKARWYEWLDPSIKKTEWSREEEEKLLHLAKLMPSQWRTIAPIVGRTAAQCMEHYERLLDAAQQKEGIDVDDDPRRLRPGEIDPNPESKPARPDPVDMDEDEKEMLSEARARLVNTQGKKAKRKAREKQLDEAKRLASLQKRRELKAAGIGGSRRTVNRRFMDYANEIPFEKQAPAGFYDVSEERHVSEKEVNLGNSLKRIEALEGKRRDEEEKLEKKNDAKRQRRLAKTQLPQQMEMVNAMNDPKRTLKRKPLQLPEPAISGQELNDIAKMGQQNAQMANEVAGSNNDATRALIGEYASTPMPTPMRTPSAAAAGGDVIMQEAANLAAMAREETPLLGGENIQLHQGTGYDGVTPKNSTIRTPAPTSTLTLYGTTPSTFSAKGTPSSVTPMRDELNINQEAMLGMEDSAKAEKVRQKVRLAQLQQSLQKLPQAQNEYEITIPEAMLDQNQDKSMFEEDAADRDARLAAQKAANEQAELNRRSTVIQQDLPRPIAVEALEPTQDAVRQLIQQEMLVLLKYDHAKFPVQNPNSKKKAKQNPVIPEMETFTDEQLSNAKNMIAMEATLAKNEIQSIDYTANADKWRELNNQVVRTADGFDFAFNVDKDVVEASHKIDFQLLQEQIAKAAKRAAKLEQRVKIMNAGHIARSQELAKTIVSTKLEIAKAAIERECFAMLQENEKHSLITRMTSAANALDDCRKQEAALQLKYATLSDKQKALATE